MEKNKKESKTLKQLYFFGGICLCLFSVTLIMNVWYIARAITFLPGYLFGIGAYLIFLGIYALGMSFLFREKGIHFKSFWNYFGIILIFFAVIIGASAVALSKDNTVDTEVYKHCLGNFNSYLNYKTNKPLPFISNTNLNANAEGVLAEGEHDAIGYGGGLIGLIIVTAIGKVGKMGTFLTWLIVAVSALLGIFLLFKTQIINFVVKSFPNVSKKNKKVANSNENGVSINSSRTYESVPPQVVAPIQPAIGMSERISQSSAPVSTPLTGYEPPMEKRKPMISQPTPISNIPNANPYANIGVFTKARFVSSRFGASQPVQPQPQVVNESYQNPKPTFAPAPTPTPNEQPIERRVEQTYLDFDAKPQIDESLVKAQPTFQEPVFQQPQQTINPYANQQTPIKKAVKWVPPSSEMLETLVVDAELNENNAVAEQRMIAINTAFQEFRIGAQVDSYTVGPSVTRYNIKYDPSVSAKAIERIIEDISIRLGGVLARFEAVVEGQYTSGLEIPNSKITPVAFKEVFEQLPDVKKHPLAVAFGKSINGKIVSADFNDFPHILVAGTTGSGKSVFVNSLITTLIMRNSPDDLKLILIDPKQVEFTKYRDIPHLLCPVVNDANQAKLVLQKLVDEMNDRYALFSNAEGCTSLKEYNEYAAECGLEKIPYIVVFVDEYADLVDTCKELGQPIVSLGQKARACGIHMLIATQRPSTNVVTGVLKGNLPTHVALMTSSYTDSMTIVNEGGAEKLLGKGDMLVQTPLVSRVGMVRLQSCFIQRKEMVYVVGYLKEHYETHYNEKFMNLEDSSAQAGRMAVANGEVVEQYDAAEEAKYQGIKEWVLAQQYMSISRIQRECGVGFNRAGRFFIRMQNEGIVALEVEGNKGCPVLQPVESEYIPYSDEVRHFGY